MQMQMPYVQYITVAATREDCDANENNPRKNLQRSKTSDTGTRYCSRHEQHRHKHEPRQADRPADRSRLDGGRPPVRSFRPSDRRVVWVAGHLSR
jgi:hypothetical protein